MAFLMNGLIAWAQTSTVGSATRSDSIDLLHTLVELDLTETSIGIIHGQATITFVPRVDGLTHLPLDLLLPTDSVVMSGVSLPFTMVDEVLTIDLQGAFGPEDTMILTVGYHGDPVTDPSGFGGFYTLPNYQYDLGVAFDAQPHSYGRAWFPCFDNFVERCTFDLIIHTNGGRSVYANGALVDITELGDGERLTHWQLDHPIPAYLTSVAAGNYAALLDTFPSISGLSIPVILAALPSDTADMRNSFLHLKNAFDTFEEWFGPYRWNRVGYVLTSAGAMEHATNICYPDFAADGTLGNEGLIAHELSHHWFGDLITCRSPEEMYINEGFAEYCSFLFLEDLYGPETYQVAMRNDHYTAVSKAHLIDGGWYALNAIPADITYGEHSYKKGADIARTLRGYMGDSLFSAGFKQVFANNAYTDMDSGDLRDSLEAATDVELDHFFNDWVFQPGGAAFSVDSFIAIPNGATFNVQVHIQQGTRGGAALFEHVPVTITLEGSNGETQLTLADLTGEFSMIELSCPFAPIVVRLNDDERSGLATTVDRTTITATGQTFLTQTDLRISTTAISGPTTLRIEEFWVPATGNVVEPFAFHMSPDRWWRIEGPIPDGTSMKLRFTVDGRASSGTGYDQGLIVDAPGLAFTEDSLVLLYRPDPGSAWTVRQGCTIVNLGSHTDGFASIEDQSFAPGDYVVAWHSSTTGIAPIADLKDHWRYFPDPATDHVTIQAPEHHHTFGDTLWMHDLHGRLLGKYPLHDVSTTVDLSGLRVHTVILSVVTRTGSTIVLGPLQIFK